MISSAKILYHALVCSVRSNMKICKTCLIDKDSKEFAGRSAACRECINKANKISRAIKLQELKSSVSLKFCGYCKYDKPILQFGVGRNTCKDCEYQIRMLKASENKIEVFEKTCFTCHIIHSIEYFDNSKKSADGKSVNCKNCTSIYRKNYKVINNLYAEVIDIKPGHKICTGCKEELLFENFWKSKLGKFGLKSNCKKCDAQRVIKYKRETGWENNRRKERRKTDVQFWIKNILRGRLYDALQQHTKGYKVTKRHSALTLLGCTMKELESHLESKFRDGMSWDNKGSYWEVDHILPCASFDLTNPDQQKLCFHYTNLQPLTIHENRSKRDKILSQAA